VKLLDDEAGLFAVEIDAESVGGSDACWRPSITYRAWRGWYAWRFTVRRARNIGLFPLRRGKRLVRHE